MCWSRQSGTLTHFFSQAKKKFFDTELENLERQQKQQVERMEQEHAVRRREEAKRIRLKQESDYTRFQEQLKLRKKEVGPSAGQGQALNVWPGSWGSSRCSQASGNMRKSGGV